VVQKQSWLHWGAHSAPNDKDVEDLGRCCFAHAFKHGLGQADAHELRDHRPARGQGDPWLAPLLGLEAIGQGIFARRIRKEFELILKTKGAQVVELDSGNLFYAKVGASTDTSLTADGIRKQLLRTSGVRSAAGGAAMTPVSSSSNSPVSSSSNLGFRLLTRFEPTSDLSPFIPPLLRG
jgi:hypothetical protein